MLMSLHGTSWSLRNRAERLQEQLDKPRESLQLQLCRSAHDMHSHVSLDLLDAIIADSLGKT